MPTLLKDLRVNEVSSVDRGAGQGVKVMLMKRKFSVAERRELASSGAAMADGSFPIKSAKDVENAVHDLGRAGSNPDVKAHIISRARTLGCVDCLPETWNVSKGDDTMTEEEKRAKEKAEKDEREKAEKAEKDKKEREAKDKESEEAKKALAIAKREIRFLKMSAKHKEYMDAADMSEDEKDKFKDMEPDERDEHMSKNSVEKRLPEAVRKALAQAEADRAVLKSLQEKDEVATFAKRAADLGIEAIHGETLRKAYRGDAAAIGKLETLLKSMSEQIRTGKVFAEFGSNLKGAGATAKSEFAEKVAELCKASPKLSEAQAFTKIYTDPAHADLKKRYDAENAPRAA